MRGCGESPYFRYSRGNHDGRGWLGVWLWASGLRFKVLQLQTTSDVVPYLLLSWGLTMKIFHVVRFIGRGS